MNSVASTTTRIICGLLTAGLVAAAIGLSQFGFTKVLDFRMLERIPLTSIAAAIPGEVLIKGQAGAISTLKAPYTGSAAIFYRYLVEREELDSEGNRSWRTIRDESQGVDFNLRDATSSALVRLGSSSGVEVNVKRRHRSQSGNLRHTEWRLESGDTVSLFAWMEAAASPTLNFSAPGHYLPILSALVSSAERQSLGNSALFLLWGGISCLIAACFVFMWVLRAHRTLLFLFVVSASCFLLLIQLGLESARTDVESGFDQVTSYLQRSAQQDLDPNASSSATDERAATRHLMIKRFERQTNHFPESWVFAASGNQPFNKVELTSQQQEIAAEKANQFSQTEASQSYLLLPIGFILSAAFAWFAMRVIRIKRIQENLPTSKTAGVTFGLAEIVGILDNEEDHELFRGPVSGALCCWYRELIQERRGSGKKAKWVAIKDEIKKQPFVVEDDEGELRVFPGKADVITKHKQTRREGRYRYSEWRLSPGDEMYVLGKARLDKTQGDSLVFGHEAGSPYIIANVPESEVMLRKALKGMGLLSLGISLLFMVSIWISGASGSFSSMDFLFAAGLAPVFLILVMLVLTHNDLIFLRERCERNWANIQVSLKKRADLIPQLENVVRQYLSHESDLLTGLALLRERSRTISSEQDMDRYMATEHISIGELQALIEQYPDLKGTALLQDFHKRLVKLENEVALIRAGFNDAITQYQTRTQTFPDNLLATVFRFVPRPLLSYSEQAHAIPIPKVQITKD